MAKWGRILAPLLVLALAVGLRAADPQALSELRLRVFDTYQRLAPREYLPAPVRVVDIDDASLERLGQWPWPRTMLADLVLTLHEAGAAAIAFDVIFAEPDRTSPARVMTTWPDTAQTAALRELAAAGRLPDHDAIFAEALAKTRSVMGFVLTGGGGGAPPPVKAGFASMGPDPKRFVLRFSGAVSALPVLAEATKGSGSLNVMRESDGVVRRIPLLVADGDQLYPSLAAEALRVAQGAGSYIVKTVGAGGETGFGAETGVTEVKIGRVVVPTDGEGRLWLYDSGAQAERVVPAWQVMAGKADERVRGAIVIVGSSAAGLKDQHATPLNPIAAGVGLHAQVLEQALSGAFLARPDWADGAELLSVAVLGLLVLALFQIPRLPFTVSVALGLAAVAGVVGASWHAFAAWRWLFDPVYPAVTGIAVYVAASLPRFLQVEGEKRRVRAAFAHYMAPAMVERLAADPKRLRLGGEQRDLTILFCDIRGFTSLAERMTADEVTQLLNRFLTPMTDAILETGGTIDKYMGDAIMAFWNAPLDDPDHAANACRAVQAMRHRLADLNRDLVAEFPALGDGGIRIGIGLNSGPCSVGNMGSERRFDYSALGDNVNLASRLEGQCKTYGVDVVLSEHTLSAAGEQPALELDLIQVKGRRHPVRIHTLVDGAEAAEVAALRAAHAAMLRAYRTQEWDAVLEAVAACRRLPAAAGLQALYDVYAERVAALRTDPPGAGWDGVFEAQTK